jgi:hypothetical protein
MVRKDTIEFSCSLVQAHWDITTLLIAYRGDQKISDHTTALTKMVHVSYGDKVCLFFGSRRYDQKVEAQKCRIPEDIHISSRAI